MRGLHLEAERAPRAGYALSEFERRTGKAVTGSSVWRHPKVRLADLPEPVLGPKDVRLGPRACGVCGSDVHFYETDKDGYMLYPGLTKFPVVIGHEFSGEVVEVGKEVRDLRVGQLVTVEGISRFDGEGGCAPGAEHCWWEIHPVLHLTIRGGKP